MNAMELLAHLDKYDIKLWLEGDRLRYSAPKDVLTPTLRAELIEKKAEILEILRKDYVAVSPTTASFIPTLSREGVLPLSYAQQGLWFLDQFAPGSSSFNIPGAIRLMGPLNMVALVQSLNEIVRRHAALRATFKTIEGHPAQVITPRATVRLAVRDLSALPAFRRESEALKLAVEEVQWSFDLERGPLVHFVLLRLGPQEHIQISSIPHIIFDGWSMDILMRELATLYQAFAIGKPSPLLELRHQYADYVLWQRQWLQGEAFKIQLDYWQQQLTSMLPLLELPADHSRPSNRTFKEAGYTFKLSRTLSEGLKALSQREGVTLFMALLAAFKTLLYRYTGQEDIVVGTTVANRTRAEFEGLIGCFVNALALRTNLAGNPTFRDLLARVREVAVEAYAHLELPFERLVEVMVPRRNQSYAPLVQVKFVLQTEPLPTLEAAGLMIRQLEREDGTNQFDVNISMVEDLTLSMMEVEGGLAALLKYNTELFDKTTISRMAGHLETLLESVVAQPEQPIATLPLLTRAEYRRMLVDWNNTGTPFSKDTCFHQMVEKLVEQMPDTVAVVFEDQQLTYYELNRRANQVAHYLQRYTVEPEKLVGISIERSLEMILGVLGILKAGGAFVPLDPAYPDERLNFMLQDSQVSVLLTQRRLHEKLSGHNTLVIDQDASWQTIAEEDVANPSSGVEADNLAYVIYTSGSTGRPKGTLVPHRGLCNLSVAQGHEFNLRAGDRVLQFSSLNFDASVWEIVMTLSAGATLCLATQDSLLPGPMLNRLLQDYAITCATLPPSILSALPPADLPMLHTLIVAGEASSAELRARWGAGRRFFNAYGPTETTICATVHACTSDSTIIPMGHPINNMEVYLLDAYLQPVPIGVTGEVYIGGVGLARGYHNRPELTAGRFIAHPFSNIPGARLYKTGDLARYYPDGSLEFLGRLDQQVKIHGYRIELGEVETVLARHPEVREAIVLACKRGTDDARLVAYVCPYEQQKLTVNELLYFLSSQLPAYMVPKSFVILDAFPLMPNGKVDRGALSKVGDENEASAATYAVPQTAVEHIIADIWQEVLEVEQVGRDDNFFDLGGHSLIAAQVASRMCSAFQLEMPTGHILEFPTIAKLAELIEEMLIKKVEALSEEEVERFTQNIFH